MLSTLSAEVFHRLRDRKEQRVPFRFVCPISRETQDVQLDKAIASDDSQLDEVMRTVRPDGFAKTVV